jgi:hypothetical protein
VNQFWQGDTYAIIKALKANGNRPGLIQQWKDAVEDWASLPENVANPDAKAVRAWLPLWRPRPFYTAAELSPIWPALAIAIGYTMRVLPQKGARRLEHELDYGGLPRVHLSWNSVLSGSGPVRDIPDARQFFIVERIHYWTDRPITMEEFQNALG